jgi:uncharacterized protein (UPF0147 family)
MNYNYSYTVNRKSKSTIPELLVLLKNNDQKISMSIRAANGISILDSISRDKRGTLIGHTRKVGITG